MSSRSLAAASCLVAVWMACACLGRSDAGEAAKEPAIKKGDKVRVINGPAPVKVGEKTLTTVDTGTLLEALEVQGNWVKVKATKDGRVYTGWINSAKHLEAGSMPQEKEPKGEAPALDKKGVREGERSGILTASAGPDGKLKILFKIDVREALRADERPVLVVFLTRRAGPDLDEAVMNAPERTEPRGLLTTADGLIVLPLDVVARKGGRDRLGYRFFCFRANRDDLASLPRELSLEVPMKEPPQGAPASRQEFQVLVANGFDWGWLGNTFKVSAAAATVSKTAINGDTGRGKFVRFLAPVVTADVDLGK